MPNKLIKEGLKQPNRIKVSFKKRAKEITGHVLPNQAWFGTEYFLAYTLSNFKSMSLTQLSNAQKDNSPLLFSLLGKCFQDVGLTEWANVVAKQCLNNADHTKANFDECIRDYLEAIAGFPNIGNQLIFWLCTDKKPAVMPMHEFMWHQVQLLVYLVSDYLHQTMGAPTAQKKSDRSSVHSIKRTRTSLLTWTRWYLPTCSEWLPSTSSVKQPTRWLAFLIRSPRIQAAKEKENGSSFYRT